MYERENANQFGTKKKFFLLSNVVLQQKKVWSFLQHIFTAQGQELNKKNLHEQPIYISWGKQKCERREIPGKKIYVLSLLAHLSVVIEGKGGLLGTFWKSRRGFQRFSPFLIQRKWRPVEELAVERTLFFCLPPLLMLYHSFFRPKSEGNSLGCLGDSELFFYSLLKMSSPSPPFLQ